VHENVFGYNRRDSITQILLITGLPIVLLLFYTMRNKTGF